MPYAPVLQPSMPATVLLAHPVVLAAEQEAAASWSDIGVARAQRLANSLERTAHHILYKVQNAHRNLAVVPGPILKIFPEL